MSDKTPVQECPRCGHDKFLFKRYEQQEMSGRFGDPDSLEVVDGEEVASMKGKTVKCDNCGYRVPKQKAVGADI